MNKRKVAFYSLLLIAIIAINTDKSISLLDKSLGVVWSEPLVLILRNNSQGLIIVFLLSLYLDLISRRTTAKISDDNIEISDSFFKKVIHLSPLKLLRRNVETVYADTDVKNLVDSIISQKPIYRDVKVSLSLSDHPEDILKYMLTYEIEFTTDNIKEYAIALVKNTVLQNQISNRCDNICDVLTIPTLNIEDFTHEINAIKFLRLSKNTEGHIEETPLKLMRVQSKNYKKYLKGISEIDFKDIILLKVFIANKIETKNTFILETSPLILDKSDHYVYWVTDRPMWIRYIEFKISNFTYNNKKNISIQPLLVNYYSDRAGESSNNKIILNIHGWVANGHGAILSWR